ncbi:MAG: redoxin family protein [Myxococcota bacterium]|nr:redoxin family protein [Myxococcota bacterium]
MPKGVYNTMWNESITRIDAQGVFNHQRVLRFTVPGAFAPGCTQEHRPDHVRTANEIYKNEFGIIASLTVDDAWTINSWVQLTNAKGPIRTRSNGSHDDESKRDM